MTNLEFLKDINNATLELLANPTWTPDKVHVADIIIRISNIAYNNSSIMVCPLDDGLYDQLMVLYQKYNPNYQVGAAPIIFDEIPTNEIIDKKIMCQVVTDEEKDSKLYVRDILGQSAPLGSIREKVVYPNTGMLSKRLISTQHKYPELVGTLDKCKFVLNYEAEQAKVVDKQSVQIFERDFIHKCLNKAAIYANEVFEMVGELKYDGVSVEAEVQGDRIITALSRGDTADNVASDLTPIFKNYVFPNAGSVPKDVVFGIKFEAVITKRNLERLCAIRNKEYKNCRNAIIGLLGAGDSYQYTDFITLIPLATSLDMPRIKELEFLNKYYSSGEYNRYCVFRGTYQEILFKVKQFKESAEIVRKILPYMIDGVVISFTDPDKIAYLGRENYVNKYSMAIKFNPRKNRTIFLGYTYSVGKSGDIIPMVHFKPCEFIGGIHTKQTIHSYERFIRLNLAIGDEIDVEYVNDVISYITKPDTGHNRRPNRVPEQFISNCPCCGGPIFISRTGKTARCLNTRCHERRIMRMVHMLDKLGFKDFGEETVRTLDITSITQLLDPYSIPNLSLLGDLTLNKFVNYCLAIKNNHIVDYKIMSALSFDGIGDEKWKIVLSNYTINELVSMSPQVLSASLGRISGVGPKIIEAINGGFSVYRDEVMAVISNINIISSKGAISKPRVAITGFRDTAFVELLTKNGFDVSDTYGVTKKTAALVANTLNDNSSKMIKARKFGIPVFTRDSFIKAHGIII